jgi:hypothetical protein
MPRIDSFFGEDFIGLDEQEAVGWILVSLVATGMPIWVENETDDTLQVRIFKTDRNKGSEVVKNPKLPVRVW